MGEGGFIRLEEDLPQDNLVVFVTPEAKTLGWSDKTIVKVSLVDGKIVIEKGMEF